ncbi:nitroreductase family protein [Aliikangiella coralliicola]|uniref:Nitroreductase family protein n=1 Tax=Aliikangiella coralliicola TaxID=2592383 RepID=A0A545UAP9_9GAMM|nr:nitroreductase family protein [Aliikangiella coralliicola]TQV86539.1 nitroreductase family protein [Aliikangiella coralliicola]
MQEHDSKPLPDFIEYSPEEMEQRSEEFYNEIKRRHTVRMFSDRPVDRKIIENCLKAAGTAPSGANHQPWHFAVISNPEVKTAIRDAAEKEERAFYEGRAGEEWLDALSPLGTDDHKPYLEKAPWLIAIFAQQRGGVTVEEERKNYYVRESVGIATGFLINALHHSGLTTLTHTPKPMTFLNEICQRPKTEKAYILLVVGYPSDDATIPDHATIKKPLEDICSFI